MKEPAPRDLGAGRDLFGLKKDGTEVPIEIGLIPITTPEGTFVITAIIDISERKKLEKKLSEKMKELASVNEQLEQYGRILSHDLKEPLRAIYSFNSLLEKKYKGKLDNTADEYINFIVSSARRMEKLIDGLLRYNQISQGFDTQQAKVNCNKIIRDILKDLKLKISKTKAEISCDPLPEIFADENIISVIFQNLIENALKFSNQKEKPKIHISAKLLGEYWLFSVKDNGIGIPEEQKERIFQVFQRLHTQEEYEGTGIGLSICKKIIDFHGGKIWVESQPLKGSTFYFTMPKKEAESMETASIENQKGLLVT